MKYQKPKGTADILPEESYKWQHIEDVASRILNQYGFEEIRTPIFEEYELFSRGVGEASDIVSKEMYEFYDKGDRHLALRPEGTASIVRAYVENKQYGPEFDKPVKYYYTGPMFRYERPQGGRMRQFHQMGVEAFGSKNPETDVEIMVLALKIFEELGLNDITLVINSLGDTETRKQYREALLEYLKPHYGDLSEDSQKRYETNPLRILDSKNKKDQEIIADAPAILDFLTEESREHFETITSLLDKIDIPYTIDSNMVRGLDYYTDTVFEIMTDNEAFGAITTLCAGGRYDNLVEEMGGPSTPGFGFAFGMERVLLTLEANDVEIPNLHPLDVYFVAIGDEEVQEKAFILTQKLRDRGLTVEKDYLNRKPKAQFKSADRLDADYVFILGEEELQEEVVSVREMETGNQEKVSLEELVSEDFIRKIILEGM